MIVSARRACAASALLLAVLTGCDDGRAPGPGGSTGPGPAPGPAGAPSRASSAPSVARPPVATATDTGTYAPAPSTIAHATSETTEPAEPEESGEGATG